MAGYTDIHIESLLEGARRARGCVAVIDVFRAFTTAAVALANGAARIIMVAGVAEALGLRAAGLGEICMGESGGRMPAGFDHGNSPFEIAGVDFAGKTILQRTSAGTQGIVAAAGAARFHDPARPDSPPGDLEIALDVDRYDFAIRVRMEDGRPVGRMELAG